MPSKKKRFAKSGKKKSKPGGKKPRASAAGAGMKVLAIDADSDPVTKAPFDYREQNVYPYFEQKGFTVVRRQGAMARRARVTPEARKPEVIYLTGVGHGFNNSYTGNSQEPIFSKSSLSTKESQGKIVHFLSCKTAAGLGPSFVAHGCKAYFGYSDNFTYPPSLAEVFFECDSEIDRGFADGVTAGEVLQRVLARFQQHIDRLKATGDGGDLFNASVLEVDLRLLRAPSLEVGFGDPNARLSSD